MYRLRQRAGYLGPTRAVGLAELGPDIVGFDVDVDVDRGKVAMLPGGGTSSYELGLRKLLQRNLRDGRLRLTRDGRLRLTTDYHASIRTMRKRSGPR